MPIQSPPPLPSYDYQVEFDAHTVTLESVRVIVNFNIDEDDIEVLEFSRFVFKKCYTIELGDIQAYYRINCESYTPTPDDLLDWKYDIERALQKELTRQTA